MKPLKIYYLSSEIYPFSNTFSLSKFSNQFTSYMNESKDIDIRLCQPKYGYISERKYILREVIRLKDMKIDFLNKERLTNIKSAFIPETRVQVYFMENDEYFKNVPDLLYKSRNGRFYQNNHEKFLFFSFATFETLKKLFWVPDIIVCNDWQTSLLPLVFKEKFSDNEMFKKIKFVSMTHSYNENYFYPNSIFKDCGLEYNSKQKKQNSYLSASSLSSINYIFDNNDKIIKKVSKTKDGKKLLSSRKNKIINNYDDKESSEKIEVFNKIINDLRKII